MAAGIRLEIQNLEEVQRIIEALGERVKTVLPQAVEAGAGVLQDRMVALGPGPAIGVEMDGATALIGPDKAHFYYTFFETGTHAHLVTPHAAQALHWGDTFAARAYPGGIAPAPFMRPAVDEGRDEVAEAIGAVLRTALE